MGSEMTKTPEAAPTTPDPIEIAMEAEAAGVAPVGVAAKLLAKQEELVGWQTASERAGFVLKVLTGVAGAAVAGILTLMAWQASRADGLLIKPFSVPPELAARGVTGEALASQMLDQLSRMSATAQASMNQQRVSADRGDNVSIEIPQTGVSLSQLDQWLREKLGRQVRVTGELMTQPDGSLRLLARVGSEPLPAQAGGPGEVETLAVRAAESIHAREQPISYAQYLERSGRQGEARAIELVATESRDRTTRAIAWSLYGNNLNRAEGPQAAAPAYRRSRAIDITASPGATGNLAAVEAGLGHAELAHQLNRQHVWASEHATLRRSPEARRNGELAARAGLARDLGDAAGWLAGLQGLADGNAEGMATDVTRTSMRAALAMPLAALHQLSDAAAVMEDLRLTKAPTPRLSLAVRMAAEDRAPTVRACDAWAAPSAGAPAATTELPIALVARCAVARARVGGMAQAEAALAATPLECQDCVLARAQLAELKGDRIRADHWFGEAVRMAPSLPQANYEWGRALLARGRADAAIPQLREALRRGPRYADAMEVLGEALLATGDAKAAAVKFAEAAKLAPKWGRLYLKWGEALAKLGKADEAQAKWRAAATMDLSPTDRAALKAHGV